MVKAIKVMLIPNNVQKTKMFQYAGASRFAYNWALAREIENYEKGGKFLSDAELRKEFTKLRHSDEYAWLLNISNNVTKQAIKDAWHFRWQKEQNVPHFIMLFRYWQDLP